MARKPSPKTSAKSGPVWLSLDEWSTKAQSGDLPHNAAIRATFDTEIKMPADMPADEEHPAGEMPMRRMSFVITTGNADRDRDVVMPSGIHLDNYLKNPVVLWAHDYYGLPIGKTLAIRNDGNRLIAEAEFADPMDCPMAGSVYRLLQKGFLRASSIGFRPVKYSMNEDRRGYDIEECELLEFSIVPVPANAEALALAASATGEPIDLAPIKAWLAGVEGAIAEQAAPSINVTVNTEDLTAAVAKFEAVAERLEKAVLAAQPPTIPPADDDIRITLAIEDDTTLFTLADDDTEPTFVIDRALVREAIADAIRTHVMVPIGESVERALNEARGRVS